MDNFDNYQKLTLRESQLLQLDVMKMIHEVCVKENITYYLIAGCLLGAVRHGGFIPWDDDIDIGMPRKDYEKFKEVFYNHFSREDYFLQDWTTDKYYSHSLMRLCIKNTIVDKTVEKHLKNCKNRYIDIFPLDNAPADIKAQKQQEKDIKFYKKLILWQNYRVYNENGKLYVLAKKVVSFFLKAIPLSYLQKKLEQVMIRYDAEDTGFLCSMASKYSYKKQTISTKIYGKPTLIKFEDVELFGPEKTIEYLTQLYGPDYMTPPDKKDIVYPCTVYVLKKNK